jgi:hypothetical protein
MRQEGLRRQSRIDGRVLTALRGRILQPAGAGFAKPRVSGTTSRENCDDIRFHDGRGFRVRNPE